MHINDWMLIDSIAIVNLIISIICLVKCFTLYNWKDGFLCIRIDEFYKRIHILEIIMDYLDIIPIVFDLIDVEIDFCQKINNIKLLFELFIIRVVYCIHLLLENRLKLWLYCSSILTTGDGLEITHKLYLKYIELLS
jgi:hypothetical protein